MRDVSEEPAKRPSAGPPDAVIDAILEAIRGVRFGQVTVIVQDGQVIQIDRIERKRLKS